jgi:hypothetical protein
LLWLLFIGAVERNDAEEDTHRWRCFTAPEKSRTLSSLVTGWTINNASTTSTTTATTTGLVKIMVVVEVAAGTHRKSLASWVQWARDQRRRHEVTRWTQMQIPRSVVVLMCLLLFLFLCLCL